jgi:hypothetical protein
MTINKSVDLNENKKKITSTGLRCIHRYMYIKIISDFYVRNRICAVCDAQLYLCYNSVVRETVIKNIIWPQCSNCKKRGTIRLKKH